MEGVFSQLYLFFQALPQTFTIGEVQFKIEVVNHFLTVGTIDLATILTQSLPAFIGGMILFATGGAGIGFAGKWIRGRFEKWLSRRKDSKSPQTLTHSNTNHQNRKSSKREPKDGT
jgi:hypothetical protein